jgi:vacuolar-type H+-ATPase subunit I/STV1
MNHTKPLLKMFISDVFGVVHLFQSLICLIIEYVFAQSKVKSQSKSMGYAQHLLLPDPE